MNFGMDDVMPKIFHFFDGLNQPVVKKKRCLIKQILVRFNFDELWRVFEKILFPDNHNACAWLKTWTCTASPLTFGLLH